MPTRSEIAGSGKMTWLVDFAGCNAHSDLPVKVRLQTLSLLQNHYPERLGLLIGYQPPRRFTMTYMVRLQMEIMYASSVRCYDYVMLSV